MGDRWAPADPVALAAWLTLQDSAFPAGRFAHSHGLEAWAAANPRAGEQDVIELARTAVTDAVAPLDAVFLAHAVRSSPQALPELDRRLGTYKITAAARTASQRTGRQLALTASRVLPDAEAIDFLGAVLAHETPGHQAVVEAAVHRHLGIGARLAVLGFLRGTLAGLLSAAVRLGRLGSLRAQRALLAEAGHLAELAADAEAAALDDAWATVPELEIHAMRHETATARLFTT